MPIIIEDDAPEDDPLFERGPLFVFRNDLERSTDAGSEPEKAEEEKQGTQKQGQPAHGAGAEARMSVEPSYQLHRQHLSWLLQQQEGIGARDDAGLDALQDLGELLTDDQFRAAQARRDERAMDWPLDR